MKTGLSILCIFLWSLLLSAQETKIIEERFTHSKQVVRKFEVLKTDNNVKHGQYIEYFRLSENQFRDLRRKRLKIDDFIKTQGEYNLGELHGKWLEYYRPGQLFSLITYNNGVKHGKYEEYNNRGGLMEQGLFQNGIKEGQWIYYNIQNIYKKSGNYRSGEKVEIWKTERKCKHVSLINDWNYDTGENTLVEIRFPASYPKEAREKSLQGVVMYSFVIDSGCLISDITILSSPFEELNSAIFEGLESVQKALKESGCDCSSIHENTKLTQGINFTFGM
jgi:antitoxin component YwqK of YwqJK toxin-antitoxin module